MEEIIELTREKMNKSIDSLTSILFMSPFANLIPFLKFKAGIPPVRVF